VVKSQRLTDEAGNVVAVVELDPWGGETERSENPRYHPYVYGGYERDGNWSDQAQRRVYHGWYSRFYQPDPWEGSYDLTDPQSLNRYAYVRNDPVNFTDPSGLDAVGRLIDQPHWTDIVFSAAFGGFFSGADILAFATDFGLRQTFGYRYWDLPGYANEAEQGEYRYLSIISTGFDPAFPNLEPQRARQTTQYIGGHFPDYRSLEIELVKLEARDLLQNPTCAAILGGVQNAMNLLNRAQVRYANTINPAYRGTQGQFPYVASEARNIALNPKSNIVAYSEIGGPGLLATNIYVNERFFTDIGPSQQNTVFIHELNRLNGYTGDDRSDYARIVQACGTANPYGPRR
jgi:RHS repeat-associated protein